MTFPLWRFRAGLFGAPPLLIGCGKGRFVASGAENIFRRYIAAGAGIPLKGSDSVPMACLDVLRVRKMAKFVERIFSPCGHTLISNTGNSDWSDKPVPELTGRAMRSYA